MNRTPSRTGRLRAVIVAACAAVALSLSAADASAQTPASIVSPQANATWHPGDPVSWSPVQGALAYYLYIGQSPGLKNLVDTGEIQATSWVPASLPAGVTVYARLWTKFSSGWKYTDRAFIAAAAIPGAPAVLQSPATGTQAPGAVPVTFSWTASSGALAYYLYVGTTAGAKDIVDTGETPLLSAKALSLPPLRTLYTRLWTKSPTGWKYTDSWFTTGTGPMPATIITPADGQTVSASAAVNFSWTPAAGALAYYLYVGTAAGLNDVVNYGETSVTTVSISGLPAARTLYVRMWTKLPNGWQFRDTIVRTRAVPEWLWPLDGAAHVPGTIQVAWLPAAGAIDYQLALGSGLDGTNLAFVDGTTSSSVLVDNLPAGDEVYGRLTARFADHTETSRIVFSVAGQTPGVWATFSYPTDGSTGVKDATTFRWTAVPGAASYYLYIGRRPGAVDIFNSGETSQTSLNVSGLPHGPLFARVWTKLPSGWRYEDVTFTTDTLPDTPVMAYPTDGAQGVDTGLPFQWFAMPNADTYRLELGRTAGAHDLLDSGSIALPRRFSPALPGGTIYGRVSARVSGVWVSTAFTFTAGAASNSAQARLDTALWSTARVRDMSDESNVPAPGTVLDLIVKSGGFLQATCAHYAIALLTVLNQSGANVGPGYVNTCLNPSNSFDCHTLIQANDPRTNVPILLDPTFGLTMTDGAATRFLSTTDMGTATATRAFDSVRYQFLSSFDDIIARKYYLDYPLLYLSLAPASLPSATRSPLQFFQSVGTSASGGAALYSVQCAHLGTVTLKLNGQPASDTCAGADRLTHVFYASTVADDGVDDNPPVAVYNVLRFKF